MGRWLGEMGHVRRLWCLSLAAGLLGLLGVAGTAYGRDHSTVVVGYVSAGAPVSGARLAVFNRSGRRLKLRAQGRARQSDADGYFALVLPAATGPVRLVASGGTTGGARVDGSLRAIAVHPGVAHVAFVNPVSTVAAAYRARHPRASVAAAARRGRRLLSLAPGDGSGLALLGATRSFDGRSFLRAARAHGGIQRYVTRLIERGERVSFRGPKRPAGVQDYLKLLTTAKDAIGSVFSIGKTAYDIFKWAQGPEPTTTDIYKAVLEMKTQLNAIQTSLTELKQKIDDGFRAILDEIKAEEFDRSVKPLEDIASTVYTTQLDFKVLIDNATAPSFNARVAEEKKGAIDRNMNEIEKALNQERDLFRNGILKKRTVPAYYHYGQTLLAGSAHFMTTADSASLQDLAGWVLQYQALAFNLIVRYENHEGQQSPNAILSDAIKTYLGFDASQAKRWVDGESPDVPTSGDLHEELAYLDTIRPVPAHTIVQAMGLDDAPGPMWQASEAAPFHVGSFVGNGRPCADVNWRFSAYGRLWCQFMWDGFNTAIDAVHHALELPGASFANWEPASADQAQALLRTRDVAKVMQIQPDYWIPLNLTPDARVDILGAWRNTEGYRTNSAGGYDEGGSYISDLIDRINLTTVKGPSGDASSCFIGVGYARKASKTGTDCPVLHLLLRRTPADDEHYWPYQR